MQAFLKESAGEAGLMAGESSTQADQRRVATGAGGGMGPPGSHGLRRTGRALRG